jgi:hypothetical protein
MNDQQKRRPGVVPLATGDDLVVVDEHGPTTDADYAERIIDAADARAEEISYLGGTAMGDEDR